MMKTFDVAIVGCGPVGAAAANLISERGHTVAIIDAAAEFHNETRAVHMDHETMRIFRGIGIDEAFRPYYTPFEGMEFVDDQHRRKFLLKAADERSGEQGYMFSQAHLELCLRDQLSIRENVDMRFGHRVTGLDQVKDGVILHVAAVNTGEEEAVFAKYVVGCDGAASFVRNAIGAELEDLGFDEPWVVVDCELLKPLDLPRFGQQVCDTRRPSTFIPAERQHRRWEFMLLPDEAPEDINNEDKLFELMGPWGVTRDNLRINRTAVYTFHALISREWRVGRVFLAGDACHQTPVFIGQGMCAGIRDAANLSWKLSLVLEHLAEEEILDSYQVEREPHVRSVIMEAIKQGQIICTTDPELAKVRDQIIDELAQTSDLSFYDSLPDIVAGILRRSEGEAIAGTVAIHPLLETADGATVFMDTATGSGFRLVSREQAPLAALSHAARQTWERLEGKCLSIAPHADSADGTIVAVDVDGRLTKLMDEYQINSLLIRPDHYVFGTAGSPADTEALITDLGTQIGASS